MSRQANLDVKIIDLGLIDYQKALDYQSSLFNSTLAVKSRNREASPENQTATENFLLFCEHPHVFTLGKSGDPKNLLIRREELATIRADYHETNRGGDITYHGPGQIVVYPVLDLENFFTDIHLYMRTLEEAVIQTLREFSISAGRIKGLTGVWVDHETPRARKICALGVKTSRWVTLHGLALNVATDLSYFNYIVPCGIADKAVTSIRREVDGMPGMDEVKIILENKLISLFGMTASHEIYSQ